MANEFNIKNGFISRGDGTINGTLTVTTISATTYSNLPPSGISGSGSTGQITFFNSSSSLSGSSQLNWDDANRVLRILGNGGSGTASYLQVTNGASGITPGDGMLIGYGTDNNARISLQDANSLILSNSSGDALVLNTGNVSSVNNHIIGGPISSLNTGTRFQIESPGSGSSDYPFRVNGLASSKIHFMNGSGQVGIYKSTTTLGSILDISSAGVLSTDIAFRVRNSSDTYNIFQIAGNNTVWSNGGGNQITNTSYGENALILNTNGTHNVAIGRGALEFNTDGYRNVAIGYNALNVNTIEGANTAVGYATLTNSTYAYNNTALGSQSLRDNTTGVGNTAVGSNALNRKLTGNDNVALGHICAEYIVGGGSHTVSNTSIFIGNYTKPNNDNQSNQIVIGNLAEGLGSNTTVIGNTSTTLFRPYGNVAIGTNSASERLEVSGKTKTTSLQVTSGATNNYVLTSDASGNATWQPATITTLSSTTATIHFTGNTVFGTYSSPISSNLTDTLTNAKLGVVQKIYHNSGTAPTVPAGWVLLGSTTYQTSTVNIIYAEWSEGTRVEYWIVR